LKDTENGKVQNIVMDCASRSMITNLESVSNNGTPSISIPRNLLDIKINQDDDTFFTLVNGEEVDYKEIKNQEARTLMIPFKSNTE